MDQSEASQINILFYCLGEEAEDVLTSTGIAGKFDAFFDVRTNVILERAKFNRRNQLEGETADTYLTVLYGLVENCNYGNPRRRCYATES